MIFTAILPISFAILAAAIPAPSRPDDILSPRVTEPESLDNRKVSECWVSGDLQHADTLEKVDPCPENCVTYWAGTKTPWDCALECMGVQYPTRQLKIKSPGGGNNAIKMRRDDDDDAEDADGDDDCDSPDADADGADDADDADDASDDDDEDDDDEDDDADDDNEDDDDDEDENEVSSIALPPFPFLPFSLSSSQVISDHHLPVRVRTRTRYYARQKKRRTKLNSSLPARPEHRTPSMANVRCAQSIHGPGICRAVLCLCRGFC